MRSSDIDFGANGKDMVLEATGDYQLTQGGDVDR